MTLQDYLPFSGKDQPSALAGSDVQHLDLGFANAYTIGRPGGPWVLVDTGTPGSASTIRRAAEQRFGSGARPEAIILTHGHGDHSGSARDLAEAWDVPIYAHEAEMPFLTGRSEYPPADPTIGGPLSLMARFEGSEAIDLGDRLETLPADGEVPHAMADWQWIHTPGHTPGHVALYRETDGTLIAGDAVVTADQESWSSLLTSQPGAYRPPAVFTPNWTAARASVERLAELEPNILATGHGPPIQGSEVARQLQYLARHFVPPERGRYVEQPARTDPEQGVVRVPPRPADPAPLVAGVTAGALGGLALLLMLRRRSSTN
jgi:glyoxylase-like metal-dependent hydrolase (beta-lactamase superfamily II)